MESSGVPVWRTSSFSSGSGECVEVATNLLPTVPVRDSKRSDGPLIVVAAGSWGRFVVALRGGRVG
ncbi:DUF397 domain-containing protein [Streptomyces sp. MS19]|uniref:DUF397 domain-containing protein n=1 Tax=Streptomyces sp. MS19 TaxID=3385972 RepID=UPI0039A06408